MYQQDELITHLQSIKHTLSGIKHLRKLDNLTKIDAHSNSLGIMSLDFQLQATIEFAKKLYPRNIANARYYFMTAVMIVKDIRLLSLECLQLLEGIQYILDSIHEYNFLKSSFPGQSRRKLIYEIEIFLITVLRSAYAISLLLYY